MLFFFAWVVNIVMSIVCSGDLFTCPQITIGRTAIKNIHIYRTRSAFGNLKRKKVVQFG